MALNLNKDNDDAKPSVVKPVTKGPDLGKKGDSSKSRFDLSKEPVNIATDSNNIPSGGSSQNKKSPVLIFLAVAALIGVAIFWFNNKSDSESQSIAEANVQNEDIAIKSNESNVTNQSAPQGEVNTQSSNAQSLDANAAVDAPNIPAEASGNSNGSSSTANNSVATRSGLNAEVKQRAQENSVLINGTIEEKALQVIRGDFGIGVERRNALGEEYSSIQAKVNEMLVDQK